MNLNLNNFRVVFDDNFAKDTTLDTQLWSKSWGTSDQYSFGNGALTLTGTAAQSWNPVGFMQNPSGKSAGEGYGLYQFTGYGNPGQGSGVAVLMWRADDMFLDASTPDIATEIDLFESLDGSQTVLSTVHYYDPWWPQNDGSDYHTIALDPSKQHTYAVDWERGSITYYIDGQEYYHDTTHVPLDAADGGSNEVMGAEVVNESFLVTTSKVQLHVVDMSYSVAIPAAVTPPVAAIVTLGGGSQSYDAAAGATVQAGSGTDLVRAAGGRVTLSGSSGSLTFINGSGSSSVQGGAGSVTAFGGAGGGYYAGGNAGRNILVSQGASGANTTLTGAAAGDLLFGSPNGNDVLNLARGRETALGGGSNTTVNGGDAASVIFTGAGSTTVNGAAAGGDTVVGGSGSLNVDAKAGAYIFGGSGALNVSGSAGGADVVIGGAGALGVTGHGGNMLVVAGGKTSHIDIGNGASLIYAGQGLTTVTGGTGSMQVLLESGKATINEGTGAAVYDVVKGAAGGVDVLNGFKPGSDVIQLFGYQPADLRLSTGGGSTLLSLGDGTQILLVGVADPGTSIHF